MTRLVPLLSCLLSLPITPSYGNYFITTPHHWVSDVPAQVCVMVRDTTAPAGTLNLVLGNKMSPTQFGRQPMILSNTTITVPAGQSNECHSLVVPRSPTRSTNVYEDLQVLGSAGGSKVNHTARMYLRRDTSRIFLQTDKYLYQPGQLVQLRALTVIGPNLAVSTEQYPEVWVTTPSDTKIAQWKDVNNSAGLIHLDFSLADESEKGVYTIHVRPPQGHKHTFNFKVEDFVLPRFEVTLRPPPFILATDQAFTFTVCAKSRPRQMEPLPKRAVKRMSREARFFRLGSSFRAVRIPRPSLRPSYTASRPSFRPSSTASRPSLRPSHRTLRPSFMAPLPSFVTTSPIWNRPQPSWEQPQPSWGEPQPSWGEPQPSWGEPQPSRVTGSHQVDCRKNVKMSDLFVHPVKGNLSLTVLNGKTGLCRAVVTKNIPISGCAEVELTAADMKINDCKVYSLDVSATVSEDGTGVKLNSSCSITISRKAVSIITVYKDKYMKPNLPYTLKVKAEQPDGSVAGGVPLEVCAGGRCTNMTTTLDGLVTAVLPRYDTNSIYIKVVNWGTFMAPSQFMDSVAHYFSPSNSSLLIHAPEGKVACVGGQASQHVLPVLFSSRDQPSAAITVQVLSRGIIHHSSTQQYQLVSGPLPVNTQHLVEPLKPPLAGTVRGVVNITISLPPTASPSAEVLVWYTRKDGEVVSDARQLQVEKCLSHNVTLTWSATRAQSGDAAVIKMTSEPDSVCSLGVVDKSAELLAEDPDLISLESLFNFAYDFQTNSSKTRQVNDIIYCLEKRKDSSEGAAHVFDVLAFFRYRSDYVDALKMFDDAGVFAFTNDTLETRPCFFKPVSIPRKRTQSRPRTRATQARYPRHVKSSEAEADTTPRTNAPETFLWELVVMPSSGVIEQQVTLPDTVTQWVAKAVCVHPQKGVGLSARQPITAFTPFFVELTLPPTVKRGEVLPVKMSVINNLDQPLPVSLTLEDSPQYEILEEAGAVGQRGKRSACVPPQDKTVLTVKIRLMKIADVNVSVSAAVDQQSQQTCGAGLTAPMRRKVLVRPIKVEAEGFLKENYWTKYICSRDLDTDEDSLASWKLLLPATLVEGSALGWVTAGGNLLTPSSIQNLGHLIRMPYCCGEQNMFNFALNIFILRYLEDTNQTTPEVRDKLNNFLTIEYQQELRYRRSDGSYSTLGNADSSGSTWLTALVLKSFAQGRDFIQISNEKRKRTIAWLLRQQGKDGCFRSVGKLLHRGMQGGVSDRETPALLTAYVMAALLEAGERPGSRPVTLGAQCLSVYTSIYLVTNTSLHPYTLALKTYALALARRPETIVDMQQLMDEAIVTNNSTHWNLPQETGSSQAVAVEIAGYAVLAMMTHDPKNMEQQARKVVKWITAQRNDQGGFYSTQDTLVALQALATYEGHLHQGPLNIQATVTATNFSHVFTVTDKKLMEQQKPLPSMPTTVSFNMTGQGCAVLQAVQRYNIPDPEPSDTFNLTVYAITVTDNLCVTKLITACASYRLADSKSSMAVMEVDLISGYIPEEKDFDQLWKDDRNIKLYEVDGSKVTFYIDELSATDTCVNFHVIREVTVEEVKAGTVVVYDYYQPEFSISKRYTMPPPDVCH